MLQNKRNSLHLLSIPSYSLVMCLCVFKLAKILSHFSFLKGQCSKHSETLYQTHKDIC